MVASAAHCAFDLHEAQALQIIFAVGATHFAGLNAALVATMADAPTTLCLLLTGYLLFHCFI